MIFRAKLEFRKGRLCRKQKMKSDIIRASGKTRGIIKGKYALSLSRRWLRVAQEEDQGSGENSRQIANLWKLCNT